MEVIKLQHQKKKKSSLWRSDDGLISEKSKAEVYLGSMESKHTTRFTRKKRAKNKPLCLHFDRFWHWKPCYYYIYIRHYFLPIAYIIFILTQRLVPVIGVCQRKCSRVTRVILIKRYRVVSSKFFSYLSPLGFFSVSKRNMFLCYTG